MKLHPLYQLLEDSVKKTCSTCDSKVDSVNAYGMCEDCQDQAQEYAHEAREETIAQIQEDMGEGTTREEAIDALKDM